MVSTNNLIDRSDMRAAETVLAGRVHRTPMMASTFLGKRLDVELYLKLEMFQKTGSFKVRGVINKLSSLSDDDIGKGVITLSAGNHAQALAWGAAQFDVRSVVVMPAGSVQSKIDAAKGYGAEVILTEENLLDTCTTIQKERDLTLIHPFDDPLIIAGQATVGLEIHEDAKDADIVVVGVGGGGLISGVAAALKLSNKTVRVIGVEPEGAPTMTRSLDKGEPIHLERIDTIADGLSAPFVGRRTLDHTRAFVDDVVLVSDRDIVAAMGLIIERCKVIAEPAAAATYAALLAGKVEVPSKSRVVCVLSGGNVDTRRLAELFNDHKKGKGNEMVRGNERL